jgi:HNH endonuclease
VKACPRVHYGHGLCTLHYKRMRTTGDPLGVLSRARKFPSVADRLAARSERHGECLLYTEGHSSRSGHVLIRSAGRTIGVHVAAWEIDNGRQVTPALVIRHSCDTPRCIEPRHLLAGTVADNNRDRDDRGRHVALRGEQNGYSKLTESDIRIIRKLLRGGLAQAKVGEQFSVSQRCIWAIAHGLTWAHVKEEGEK